MNYMMCGAPLFVVGVPRSGTTILAAMLTAHSQTVGGPETHFFPRLLKLRSDFGEVGGASFPLANLIRRLLRTLQPQAVRAAFWREACNAGVGIDRIYFVENTPAHLEYLPVIKALFPNARFVVIVRDPRAVFASLQGMPWSTTDVPRFCARWKHYYKLAWAQKGGADYVVSYETLINDPAHAVGRLQCGVGLEPEPVWEWYRESSSALYSVREEPWKQGVSEAVDSSRIDAWEKVLRPTDIRRIESFLGPILSEAGYAADPNGVKLRWRERVVMSASGARLRLRAFGICALAGWYKIALSLSRGDVDSA
jgi:hypothetical protein